MKKVIIMFFLILLLTVSVFAQTAVKPIPIYPSGKITFETNLTDKDFIPIIKQWINVIPSMISAEIGNNENLNNDPKIMALKDLLSDDSMEKLGYAISDLKSINMIGYSLPSTPNIDFIADFYMQKLGLSKEWTLTLRFDEPSASVRIYTMNDFKSFFGYVITQKDVFVIRTNGKIDLGAISQWATKAIPIIRDYFTTQKIENTPSQPVEVLSDEQQPIGQ